MMCALLAFFALAVVYGPFPDSDAPLALLTAFAGLTAMGMQNAVVILPVISVVGGMLAKWTRCRMQTR